MADNAWNLITNAGIRLSDIEALALFRTGKYEAIAVAEARAMLEGIAIFTDYDDPQWNGFETPNHRDFGVQIWTKDYIYRSLIIDGIVRLDRIARTVEILVSSTRAP